MSAADPSMRLRRPQRLVLVAAVLVVLAALGSIIVPLLHLPAALLAVPALVGLAALLPIIDLRAYLGSGPTPNARASRVIVVNHRDIPAGLVVDEVLGFRRFADAEFTADVPPTIVRCERYIAGSFRRGNEQWPVLGLRALVEDPAFSEASA